MTALLGCLSQTPQEVTDDNMEEIEKFVVLPYSHTSTIATVNAARKQVFSYGNRKLKTLLLQQQYVHVYTSTCQSRIVPSRQTLAANPSLQSCSEWGGQKDKDGNWTPTRTTLSEAIKRCHELMKCNHKKCCLGRCECHKANLKCTWLCFCGGHAQSKITSITILCNF